jgi:hypothetical protein
MSYWLFFFAFGFVVLGARLLLALLVIYYLTPMQSRCIGCDGDTITIAPVRGLAGAGRLLRLERRWCVRCGRTTLTRCPPAPVEPAARAVRRRDPRRHPHG